MKGSHFKLILECIFYPPYCIFGIIGGILGLSHSKVAINLLCLENNEGGITKDKFNSLLILPMSTFLIWFQKSYSVSGK